MDLTEIPAWPPRVGPWESPPVSEEQLKYLSLGQKDQPDYQPNPAADAWFPEHSNPYATRMATRLPGAHGILGVESQNPMRLNVSSEALDSASNVASGMHNGGTLPANQRPEYTPSDCLEDIGKICKDAQARLQAVGQAITRQPGVPGNLTDLMSNDLRNIAQQVVSISFHARMLEKKLDEQAQAAVQDRVAVNTAHAVELSSFRRKLHVSLERAARLEQELHDIESGHGNVDKRRKVELEKKSEKINNQKRRIKEQQDQIEKLKEKYIHGPRAASKLSHAPSRAYDDSSSSDPEFPSSATSGLNYGSSPPIPEPRYHSTLSAKDEEFLLNQLRKLEIPPAPMDIRHIPGGPPTNPLANFGAPLPMPAMGAMGSMNPMGGASMGHYGGYPTMGAYGPQIPSSYGNAAPYGGPSGYQMPPQQAPSRQSRRDNSRSSRASEPQGPTNALVVRRNDDSEIDPEVKMWKDMFMRLFRSIHGWAEMHCMQIVPGAAEEATSKNPKLWDYILKIANCHKDIQAAPKHALFMLNSPSHRAHFISRLLLQYIEQEMFTWKFWLNWDDDTDVKLYKFGPIIEVTGHPLETRRDARQQIRRLVEEISKDEDYSRFRQFKQTQHVGRFKDIAGPFLRADASKDAMIELHSIANTAMEISMKMMTSRLSFNFTWNECAVKFAHDSHIALNSDLHGLSLQHKHIRVAIVVTPGISYRDDTGRSIVPRGVAKAQVLIMN